MEALIAKRQPLARNLLTKENYKFLTEVTPAKDTHEAHKVNDDSGTPTCGLP